MVKHKCWNCGEPSETSVQQQRGPLKRRRFICTAAACWKKYWKEVSDAEGS